MLTSEQRKAHIEEAVDDLDDWVMISWHQRRRADGYMQHHGAFISIPANQDATINYLVALHEVGHRAHRHVRLKKTSISEVIRQEIEAWEFAISRSREPVGHNLINEIVGDLDYYLGKRFPGDRDQAGDQIEAFRTRYLRLDG